MTTPAKVAANRALLRKSKNPMLDHVVQLAGGVNVLARDLGVSRVAVQQWRRRGWLPLDRATQCRDLYGAGLDIRPLIDPKIAAAIKA